MRGDVLGVRAKGRVSLKHLPSPSGVRCDVRCGGEAEGEV